MRPDLEDLKEDYRDNALRKLREIAAIKELIKNNSFNCEIHVNKMKIVLSDNAFVKDTLTREETEIKKFLKGMKNEYSKLI